MASGFGLVHVALRAALEKRGAPAGRLDKSCSNCVHWAMRRRERVLDVLHAPGS